MAIGTPTYNGGATTNAGGTSFAVSPSTSIGADNYVLLVINRDNNSTTDGDNGEVTGVTDTQGNTWTKLKEMTNGQGAANGGTMISVWGCRPSGTYGTTQATVTFGAARDALSCYFIAVPIASGVSLQLDGSASNAIDATTGFGSSGLTGLASKERVWIRACCKEGNGTTAITATSGWTSFGLTGQNGPTITAANHIMYRAEYKVATSTGETSNPTWSTSGDAAAVLLAMSETTPEYTLTGNGATEEHTSTTGEALMVFVLTSYDIPTTWDSGSTTWDSGSTQWDLPPVETHTSTTGAIEQIIALQGDSVTETHTSTTGSIGGDQPLAGNGATEAHTSTTGAITQTFTLTGVGATEAHSSTDGAIGQLNTLTGANCTQLNQTFTGSIGNQTILLGGFSIQRNGATSGQIYLPPICPDALSPMLNLPETIWDGGATLWDYGVRTQWDLGIGACPALGAPAIPDGSTCAEVPLPMKPDSATCTQTIEPRMLR